MYAVWHGTDLCDEIDIKFIFDTEWQLCSAQRTYSLISVCTCLSSLRLFCPIRHIYAVIVAVVFDYFSVFFQCCLKHLSNPSLCFRFMIMGLLLLLSLWMSIIIQGISFNKETQWYRLAAGYRLLHFKKICLYTLYKHDTGIIWNPSQKWV